MINRNCSWYSIDVTPPFYTQLVDGQQLFFSPTIAAFRWHILAAMVSSWMQTIIILLKQYSPSSIMISSVSMTNSNSKFSSCKTGRLHRSSQSWSKAQS